MNDKLFENWVINTAETLDDISGIVKMVGIDFIDADHMNLVQYLTEINRLIKNFEKNETSLVLLQRQEKILRQLYDYAVMHFKREEVLLGKYKLKSTEEQKKQHANILSALSEILENIENGNTSVNSEMKTYLLNWLVEHINIQDQKAYCINNWKKLIIEAGCVDDIKVLIKKTGIEKVDVETEKFLEKLFSYFNDNKAIDTINKKINNDAAVLLSFIEEFTEKYDIHSDGILSELERVSKIVDKLFSEVFSFEELKFFTIKEFITFISITVYRFLSATKHMDLILMNSDNKEDISSFIKSTGIKSVDYEHTKFVEVVLEMNENLKKATDETIIDVLTDVTDKLIIYASEHFKNEEVLMDKNKKLPAVEEHKLRHRQILKSLDSMKQYILNGKVEIHTILRSKILNIWINHTNTLDQITFNKG